MIAVLRRAGLGLLCGWLAAGAAASGQAGANRPAIQRLDAFVAMRYDATRALVMFATHDVPASLGVPAGAWPKESSVWAKGAKLLLVRSGGEEQWAEDWPGGKGQAPQLGEAYELALGGGTLVRGMLSNYVFIPTCGETWLAGLVSVQPEDREIYRKAAAEGYVAYPARGAAHEAVAWAAVGPVLPAGMLDASARMKIEAELRKREVADYSSWRMQREDAAGGSLPVAQSKDELLDGRAQLSYTAQRVAMGGDAERYYVRGLWRTDAVVYKMAAWFTPDWKLETVAESEPTSGKAVVEDEHIVNVFPLTALPMMDQSMDGKDRMLLLEAKGLYSLKQWRPGELMTTGIYFVDSCE